MAIDKDKNIQILVTFPKVLLEEIEQYWHQQHIKNRSEAIRVLVQKGLEKDKE